MSQTAKFTCKQCGGNRFDIVHEPGVTRQKRCRCCYHTVPMKFRRSAKRDKLEALLQSLIKGSKR